jgi:FAD/FMN-containing dehydrogenase
LLDITLERRLHECLPADRITTDPKLLKNNSTDYAWFSNVLEEDLNGCTAQVVAWPATEDELAGVLAAAYDVRAPVTIRGGGTGNYGQCVPLRGGLVVNTERLNAILTLEEGRARVQAGVRFVDLDGAAAASGQEICIYPSTYLTATIAGFAAGGSMGVGSVMHGTLVDDNVLGATVLPVVAAPTPEYVEGPAIARYLHAYGTTGVLQDVTVPLTPRKRWEQGVISFPSLAACHEFCLALLTDPALDKRLITSVDPGVVQYFSRARLRFDRERTAALLLYREDQRDAVQALAARHGGRPDAVLAPDSKTRITDFTWNHTTLWAKKADRRHLTYLQCRFDVERFPRQIAAIRAEYGDDFAFHGEYALSGGAPFLASLPIVAYRGRDHLDRMVAFLESMDVFVANPHRYLLEEGSSVENVDELVETKRRNDPAGLLNPGKLASWTEHGAAPRKRATFSLASTRKERRA